MGEKVEDVKYSEVLALKEELGELSRKLCEHRKDIDKVTVLEMVLLLNIPITKARLLRHYIKLFKVKCSE